MEESLQTLRDHLLYIFFYERFSLTSNISELANEKPINLDLVRILQERGPLAQSDKAVNIKCEQVWHRREEVEMWERMLMYVNYCYVSIVLSFRIVIIWGSQ